MRKKRYYIVNDEVKSILKKYDIPIESDITVPFYEDSEYWEAIANDFQAREIQYIRFELEFTEAERSSSNWLTMRSIWHWKYPQPESNYETATYGEGNYCGECGTTLKQNNPFKIKKSPNWGKKHFLQLNWVDDEIFIKRETFELLVKENFEGLSSSPVVQGRENKAVENVLQLKIDNILAPGFLNEDAVESVCKSCNNNKYFHRENMKVFRKDIFEQSKSEIYKSNERFGSPDLHVAARLIIVSNRLYRFLTNNKLDKDLEFHPIGHR